MDEEPESVPEGVTVLRAIWTARGAEGLDKVAEIGAGTGRACRRLKDVGAGPVDDEQRIAWRDLLAREGKLGATTVADLLAGEDTRSKA
jgi:hypothetical protein